MSLDQITAAGQILATLLVALFLTSKPRKGTGIWGRVEYFIKAIASMIATLAILASLGAVILNDAFWIERAEVFLSLAIVPVGLALVFAISDLMLRMRPTDTLTDDKSPAAE